MGKYGPEYPNKGTFHAMESVAVTTKVAVFCLLSSRSLMGTFFEPFDEKMYFPWEIYENDQD